MFGNTLATEILSAEGVADIVSLTQHPLARINESFAFCHHGGWYECSMQTHALCMKHIKPSAPYAMYDFVECNFGNLGQNDADNNRLCAKNASIPYETLWKCATGYGGDSGPGLLLEEAPPPRRAKAPLLTQDMDPQTQVSTPGTKPVPTRQILDKF